MRACILCILWMVSLLLPVSHEAKAATTIRFVRDAEIEAYLRTLATPIYHAADIDPSQVTISIVESTTVNAFVAEGMNEFFYTGLLQLTDSPEQLVGVIAHETGHIAGGHLIRGKEEMRNASSQAILGMLLAIGAGVASGNAGVAASAMSGSQTMAERSFLSYSRTQESAADSAAMNFLDQASITSRGMMEFFEKLQAQEFLSTDRQAEFVRTHPMTQSRIDAVKVHLDQSPFKNTKMDSSLYSAHERMRAKLQGYLQPEMVLLRYTPNDARLSIRYAYAVALYRTGKTDQALGLSDSLIAREPQNPYFYELKAQILFENGRIKDSIPFYKKANDLSPQTALLLESYGHALIESRDASNLDKAIEALLSAVKIEPRNASSWRLLAAAWGRKTEITREQRFEAMATYALAEEAAAKGDNKQAAQLAERAMKNLPPNTPLWLRAQDIKLSINPDEKH